MLELLGYASSIVFGYMSYYEVCGHCTPSGWSFNELQKKYPELTRALQAHEKSCQNFHTWTHSPFEQKGEKVLCAKCGEVVGTLP